MNYEEFVQFIRSNMHARAKKKGIVIGSPEYLRMSALYVMNEAPPLARKHGVEI